MQRTGKEILRHFIFKSGLAGLHLKLRKARGQNIDHLLEGSLANRFSLIYRNGVWLNGKDSGALSGAGSEVETTETIRQWLPDFLDSIGCKTLLDVGCGDFNWMKEVQLPCRYIGVDIVEEVIAANQAKYGSDLRTFQFLDGTRDPLPKADAVLCREVLFHLSFDDIRRVVENVKSSGASYFITTTCTGNGFNADILSGDFRVMNLSKPPFLFPAPERSTSDEGVEAGRLLAAWKVSDLPKF